MEVTHTPYYFSASNDSNTLLDPKRIYHAEFYIVNSPVVNPVLFKIPSSTLPYSTEVGGKDRDLGGTIFKYLPCGSPDSN